jgi:3-dehydroquinate synthase
MLEGEEICAENIEQIISRSLRIKVSVVECDERESGVRRVLNFGHTLGHAIEAVEGLSGLLHGECVGLGILAVITPKIREKVVPVLKKLGLPTSWGGDTEAAISFISHDKKCDGDMISAVLVSEIGSYEIKKMTVGEFADRVRNTPLK